MGEDVQYLQLRLNRFYGPVTNPDGIFGYETQRVVKRFQADCNILMASLAAKPGLFCKK